MPMAWPFLSAMAGGGGAAGTAASPALHSTVGAAQLPATAQQLLLAQRGIPRRRYIFFTNRVVHSNSNSHDARTKNKKKPTKTIMVHVVASTSNKIVS